MLTVIPVSASNLSALAFIASRRSSEYWTQNSTVWPFGLAFSISAAVTANNWEENKNVVKKTTLINNFLNIITPLR